MCTPCNLSTSNGSANILFRLESTKRKEVYSKPKKAYCTHSCKEASGSPPSKLNEMLHEVSNSFCRFIKKIQANVGLKK